MKIKQQLETDLLTTDKAPMMAPLCALITVDSEDQLSGKTRVIIVDLSQQMLDGTWCFAFGTQQSSV